MEIVIQLQIAEHDLVTTQLTTWAVHDPTGRRVVMDSIRIDRLKGDRIAEHWSVADSAGLMRQLQAV